MSRPCTSPDGGCGEPVEFLPTGRTKPDGKPVLHVVDASPAKRIVLVWQDGHGGPWLLAPPGADPALIRGRVIDTWVDHHSTCSAWLAKLERERAAKAGRV
jgi:hypothetical protein